jgi:hypothetical protein
MARTEHAAESRRREAALEWLAEQATWEARLDELRRPRGGRPSPKRRPRPDAGLRRAG